jgi:Rrf2 family cysteine metabolism transcriptional repressor
MGLFRSLKAEAAERRVNMKLSTKGRYGSRAMLDLALHYNEAEGPVALNSIAERQNISEEYLEQIFSSLRKSGLVESVRGAQGGYRLGKNASKITVGDILRVLEGSLSPVDCVQEENPVPCERYEDCVMKDVWRKMRDSINEAVDAFTLADLVENFNAKKHKSDFMYFI